MTDQKSVFLKILGEFSLTASDRPISIPGRKKKALLAVVALAPNQRISRHRLKATLWSDRSTEQANNSLKTTLSELRRHIGQEIADSILQADRESVWLNMSEAQIDLTRLSKVAYSHSISDKLASLELCDAELLDGMHFNESALEDEMVIQRDTVRHIQQRLLRDVLKNHMDSAGEAETIVGIADKLRRLDPSDEYACRAAMLALSEAGEKARALQWYDELVTKLANDYQVAPEPDTQQVFEAIRNNLPDAHNREPQAPSTSPTGLSVGVLLFNTFPDDEGLASDFSGALAAALSNFSWLTLVPTRTSFALASQGMAAQDIGRRLGIAYAIDGQISVRQGSVSATVQLYSAKAPDMVWWERFSCDNVDALFSTEVLGAIVSRLEVQLRTCEIRLGAESHGEADALTNVLTAINKMHHMTWASFQGAREDLERAQSLAPNFSEVYSWLAFWHVFSVGQRFPDESAQSSVQLLEEARNNAKRAIELNPENALALAIYGHATSFLYHDFQSACQYFDRSLKLNPNSSFAWMLSSATYGYLGDAGEALRRLDHSELLCPIEPHYELLYKMSRTIASFVRRDYRSVIRWGESTVRENESFTNSYKFLIAGLGHLGQVDKAQTYLNRLLIYEPHFEVEAFVETYPFARVADKERLLAGLIKAEAPRLSDIADHE